MSGQWFTEQEAFPSTVYASPRCPANRPQTWPTPGVRVCFSPYAHTVLGLSEEPATVASWEVGFVYSGCTALSKYCCVNGTTTRAAPGRFVLQRHSSKAQLLFCLLLGSNPRALVIYCRPRQSMTSCTTRAQSLWPVSRAGTKTLIIPHPSRGRVSGQVPHLLLWVQTQGLGNPCQVF